MSQADTSEHPDGDTEQPDGRVLDAIENGDGFVVEAGGRYGGSKRLVAEECPRCGCNRALFHLLSLPGVYQVECPACEYIIDQG